MATKITKKVREYLKVKKLTKSVHKDLDTFVKSLTYPKDIWDFWKKFNLKCRVLSVEWWHACDKDIKNLLMNSVISFTSRNRHSNTLILTSNVEKPIGESMKIVRCKSGLRGWRSRLREVYANFEEFCGWDHVYNIAQRLGYKSVFTAWRANPMIEGSVNHSDFRKVR